MAEQTQQPSPRSASQGISCPGCPHRAAYVACREALGRGRGRVICGNAGCENVGFMHPAATTCMGGEDALLDRYKIGIPSGGSASSPAADICIHFIPDTELSGGICQLEDLAAEGTVTILAVLASSRDFLTRDAIENLASKTLNHGCLDATIVDPFDSQRCSEVLAALFDRPGVHAVVFAAPCAQLQRGEYEAEPAEIDAYACSSCHRCQQITGCPAIDFAPPVFSINAEACAGCDLCVDYCRTNVIYSPRSRMTPEERSRARYAAACQTVF